MDEWVSLNEVYEAYLDCRKRKRSTNSCAAFEVNEAANIYALFEELNNGTYAIGVSDAFCVTRPKVREVFAADFRDRIVHHLLMQKTGELFEAHFIDNTFNCRKGKGTGVAHRCAAAYAKEYADGWVLDCDISGFFMSIPKRALAERLQTFLREHYKGADIEHVLRLTRMVVLHEPQRLCRMKGDTALWEKLPVEKSLFTCGEGLGMAIGNLTSQIYANFYLSDFDRWIIAKGVGYCRYVDDFKVFAKDRKTLLRLIPEIREYLQRECGLKLHPRKLELQPVRHGFKFVGVAVKGGRIYIGNRTIGNAINMLRIYNALPDDELVQSVDLLVSRYNSYSGYMRHYKTYAVRWKVWNAMHDNVKKYVYLSNHLCVLHARAKYRIINQLKKGFYDCNKHGGRKVQSVRKKPHC